MRTIGHFIGGREVNGASGRFADVFEPMTGDVQAQVALASKAELRAAVENAKAAQPEWGATNPQRRARVMMKFLELAQRDYDKLADLLARVHGKAVPDAKGDTEAVDAILDDPDIRAVGFVGASPIAQYIYERAAATGKRAQCFGGAKNHAIVMPDADMDQTVDALIGAGYGSAGERCMAISVAVPVGKATGDRLMERLIPRVENLKIGTSIDPSADYGPLVTRDALNRVKNYVDIGIKEGAKLAVDGRGFKMQ